MVTIFDNLNTGLNYVVFVLKNVAFDGLPFPPVKTFRKKGYNKKDAVRK